jgi:aminoethylphosphonate catabolism LysR family transcriptional regulator
LTITRRYFEIEKQALELLSESLALRSGSMRIIADSAHHLLYILGRFRQKYPGIEVSVHSGNSQEVIARLYDYEADIGVLGEVPKGSDFETIKLNSTPLIAFAAKGQAVSEKRSISLSDLLKQPLVLRERGSKTRQKLEEAAAGRGLPLKAAIEAEGREAVREIVATGAGVGIVSAAEFSQHMNLVPIQIADCEIRMEEALICLRERAGGKLVRAFLEIAIAESPPANMPPQHAEPISGRLAR